MLISIIIPTLNEQENIQTLVPYLYKNATAHLLEIIVVDALKSTDKTAEVAGKLNARVIRCNECSRAAQMNLGAEVARGEVLHFIHADVVPPKKYMKAVSEAISNKADYGFFSYQFDSKIKALRFNAAFTKYPGLFSGGGDQTLFIKKTVFQELNGFRREMVIMEDFDFTKRARRAGYHRKIIRQHVLVSARKYEKNSYVRVNLVNLLIFFMYWMGFSAVRLQRTYRWLLA